MTAFEVSTVLAAVLASSIAVRVLWRESFSIPGLAFGAGMFLLALESVLGCFALTSTSPAHAVTLLQWRLVVLTFVPGVWLIFALTYSRGNYSAFLRSWRLVLAVLLLAPPATVLLFHNSLVSGRMDPLLRLGLAGRTLHVFLIIGATAVLMNVERTFRASVGVMRWQLKFMVIGLAALFLTRVYVSSQALLYSTIDASFDLFQNIALCIASILGFVSLHRTKAFNLDLQPSQTLVYQSLAVLLIGGYLLAVGFLAKAATLLGGTRGFPLQALLLLLAFICLGALLLSDRIRLHGRRFVSRHLRRPVHNFREVWSRFSQETVGHVDETGLCRATVKWIAETLDLLSVSAWLVPPGGGALNFAASTALTETTAERLKPDQQRINEALEKLREKPFPIDIDESRQSWVAPLREFHPSQFAHGGHRVCVPIAAGDQLLGIIMVGDRVGTIPLSMEDLDLLKCVGDEVARDLARIRLSHRLAEAKELQAFQTMATFFVHDLKNTAWTLSLLVQNLREHFDRPEFRDDAIRAVSKSVDRINDLIGRLGSLRQELQLNRAETDLNRVVEGVLKEFNGVGDVQISKTLGSVPAVTVDEEQIHKVILNVMMNAKDAVKKGGEIHVRTEAGDRGVMLTVRDNGCGMSPVFLKQQLFRPFQTTKKKGIGIGMFQSKMIVEAHGGKIDVISSEGAGTTFRITLPMTGGQN